MLFGLKLLWTWPCLGYPCYRSSQYCIVYSPLWWHLSHLFHVWLPRPPFPFPQTSDWLHPPTTWTWRHQLQGQSSLKLLSKFLAWLVLISFTRGRSRGKSRQAAEVCLTFLSWQSAPALLNLCSPSSCQILIFSYWENTLCSSVWETLVQKYKRHLWLIPYSKRELKETPPFTHILFYRT